MFKMNVLALFITFMSYYVSVDCIMFNLPPNTQKCLREELKANAILAGEYEVSEVSGQKVDYKVTDSKQNILAQNKDVTRGKFSVVTETQDVVEICFISHVPPHLRGMKHEVLLNTKRGVEAKPYEGVGEAAKLKPIEVELKKLEDLSDAIVQDFVQMRDREREMRDTNESTNNRVLYLGIFGMSCLFGLGVWQVLYLRWFFRSKKLIE